jgi:hypothetical protein
LDVRKAVLTWRLALNTSTRKKKQGFKINKPPPYETRKGRIIPK